MSMQISINIQAAEDGTLTEREQGVIAALNLTKDLEVSHRTGEGLTVTKSFEATPEQVTANPPAPEEPASADGSTEEGNPVSAEEKPAPKTRAPRKAAASTTRAAVLEDAPAKEEEPTPEPSDEDLLNDDSVTLEKALEVAGDMLNNGKKDKVMAALKAVGARKVGQIEPKKLADFMEALGA